MSPLAARRQPHSARLTHHPSTDEKLPHPSLEDQPWCKRAAAHSSMHVAPGCMGCACMGRAHQPTLMSLSSYSSPVCQATHSSQPKATRPTHKWCADPGRPEAMSGTAPAMKHLQQVGSTHHRASPATNQQVNNALQPGAPAKLHNTEWCLNVWRLHDLRPTHCDQCTAVVAPTCLCCSQKPHTLQAALR